MSKPTDVQDVCTYMFSCSRHGLTTAVFGYRDYNLVYAAGDFPCACYHKMHDHWHGENADEGKPKDLTEQLELLNTWSTEKGVPRSGSA